MSDPPTTANAWCERADGNLVAGLRPPERFRLAISADAKRGNFRLVVASNDLPVDDVEVHLIRREARPLVRRDVKAVRVREWLSVRGATSVDKRATGARPRHKRDSHGGVPPRRGNIAKLLGV